MRGCFMIGCGVIAVLVLLAVGGIGFFSWKAGSSFANGLRDAEATNAEFPFTPPADRRIPAERFVAYLRVRTAAAQPIRNAFKDLEDAGKKETGGFVADIKRKIDAISGISEAFAGFWSALSQTLRSEKMSLAELRWIEWSIHGAIVCASRTGDKNALELVGAFQRNDPEDEESGAKFSDGGYGRLRGRLERDCDKLEPANLALAIAHKAEFLADDAGVIVDAFILNVEEAPGKK